MSKKSDTKQYAEMYNEVRDEFTRTVSGFKDDVIHEVTRIFDEKTQEMRNENATFKDEMLGEIQNLRDDMEVTKGYGDRIEDHEERISTLELPTVN